MLLLLFLDLASAIGWQDDAAARRLLAPWQSCAALRREISEDVNVRARSIPGGVEAFVYSEGNGRDGYGDYLTMRFTSGRCDFSGWETEGPKEWLDEGLRSRGADLTQIAARRGALLVEDVDAPELAAARILMLLDSRDCEGPRRWPAQAEHPGRPRGGPAAIWRPAALRAAGVVKPWLANEEGERFDALSHGRVREPRLLVANGKWEIWELRFRARNGGGLIAAYDRERDRHRWLWGTHDDPNWDGQRPLDAQSFRVELADDRLTIRNQRIVIDLTNGSVH